MGEVTRVYVDLKGKNLTYDYNGKVMVYRNVKTDTLKPYKPPNMEYNVEDRNYRRKSKRKSMISFNKGIKKPKK